MKTTVELASEHARKAVNSLMSSYPDSVQLPPAGRWHYHQGVFLLSVLRLWELSPDPSLLEYVRRYAQGLIGPNGELELAVDELDAMQAGNILFALLDDSDGQRYRKALDYIISLMEGFGRTDQGGFWHKEKYPNQQWLDGLYMAGPISVCYARLTGSEKLYDEICFQARLIYDGALDKSSGLLRHGFDRSKSAPWADSQSGQAPEVWGRALGWFPAALLDILDNLPNSHRHTIALRQMFTSLMEAILRFQDDESKLWYQVIDQGDDGENWIESSCSSLFIYSLAKGIRNGLLDVSLKPRLEESYRALLTQTSEGADGYQVGNICIGTSIGTREYYYSRPTSINDLHGVGAFVLASVETARALA